MAKSLYQVRKELPGRFVVWNCCSSQDQFPVLVQKTKAAAILTARLLAGGTGGVTYTDTTK
jgi:hypothetical protein